jgi:membrane protease subunit HflK
VDNEFGQDDSSPSPEDFIQAAVDWISENPFTILLVALLIFLLAFGSSMVYQVDRDEEAVVLRMGDYTRLTGPGLHFKMPPPLETVHVVNTQRVFTKEFGFRTQQAGVRSTRDRAGFNDEALMLTGDLGVARVEWVVQYRRSEPRNYLFNVQNEKRLIRDAAEEAMRRIVGDYEATDVITVARVKIAKEVQDELQSIMGKYNAGIQIADLLIQSSEPPDPVAPAFKEVDSARQDRERLRYEAEQRRETVINEAKGMAEKIVQVAQGDSAAMINRARGDAERFREVMLEYEEAPRVTKDRLFLERMEEVMQKADPLYVVDKNVKSLLPMLDLKKGGTNQ